MHDSGENLVYYHLPNDKEFSLEFVNPDRSVVEDQQQGIEGRTLVREYELEQTVYALYTARQQALGPAEDLDYDFSAEMESFDAVDRTIAIRILGLFRTIIDQTYEEERKKLRAYKRVDLDKIPDALGYVNWDGTVPEIGGSLLSNLILTHPLPNANHRTSLALLELYIQAHRYGFDLPEMATEEFEWRGWANQRIRESKRLLTVRRNASIFYYLWKFGCDVVERKGSIQIRLETYALDIPQHIAYDKYGSEHEELCTDLTEQILYREEYSELVNEGGMTKKQFAKRLREMP
ncbi:hypothetical protein [Haloarchaeobius sp. FL176]|uniref:hypothetical protein n=1 Tax=Haloarchaeobius sp. FL176 TaxID=2967129 RepID=UPI00214789EA|nr:hypothetical protein [Haloarchaeobius sp. FL176]